MKPKDRSDFIDALQELFRKRAECTFCRESSKNAIIFIGRRFYEKLMKESLSVIDATVEYKSVLGREMMVVSTPTESKLAELLFGRFDEDEVMVWHEDCINCIAKEGRRTRNVGGIG